jgi:hypothetical protein
MRINPDKILTMEIGSGESYRIMDKRRRLREMAAIEKALDQASNTVWAVPIGSTYSSAVGRSVHATG